MDFPVYEFRPLPDFFRGAVRRFADGQWVPDDGEYDLAFICASGAPICLYFSPPYQRNIICSWLTTHWTGTVADHPRNGNPWHYALKDGTTDWGGDWGRDKHPNKIAGDKGVRILSSERGCANGRGIEFHADDKHIAAGLLRERNSKKVFEWPRNMTCMYCGVEPPVSAKCEAA